MPRSWTDEAIVLRTYNVGETDRFCILLTKSRGRMAARASGVRRLTSRRGAGLLPLHRIHVTLEAHTLGATVTAAQSIDSHSGAWRDPHAFSCAERGIELLLKFIEDGHPLDDVYALTCDFLSLCCAPHAAHLTELFTLKLLTMLGISPSVRISSISHHPLKESDDIVFSPRTGGFATRSEESSGVRLSKGLVSLLRHVETTPLAAAMIAAPGLESELRRFVQRLLGSQLGVTLSAPGVSLALSSAVTPICHVSGRAS